ncbi:MAG TPA: protease, partial [Thermoanaerobaculia bacterium]|nr:protease [Thermoanaerobaculia bacterium]
MHRTLILACLASFTLASSAPAAAAPLMRSPALSRSEVAFVHAGDLWVAGREGGQARRLTTGVGVETDPYFSPDGGQIAFTGEYEGNLDVYVVPASGGVPRRLTHHPGRDRAAGWTPDGKQVLFRSERSSYETFSRLYTVPPTGGFPADLPLPMAEQGSYSADGSRLAYVPQWNQSASATTYRSHKRYRGGLASPIWLARLADSSVEEIPRQDANDWNPMWVGDRVYFLSDREGPATLYAYDTRSRQVTRVVDNPGGPDIMTAAAADGAIVYEQLGRLHLLDLASGRATALDIRVQGDLPGVRPRFVDVSGEINKGALSPTGVRAVFEARGDILTVPVGEGAVRNLTQTPGVAERDPAWSPDGRSIAYFSDESGEYALHVREQTGTGEVRKVGLGEPPSFFYAPLWSPDSRKVVYTDKRLNVWWVDVAGKGRPVKIDTDTYDAPLRRLNPVWAPDSRWIAYTKQLPNHMRAVFVYSLESGKARQVTDAMSDAMYAAFDKNGQYLYFTASTDVGPTTGWLDLSSVQRPVSRNVYAIVLDKTLPSPLAPRSDEEEVTEAAREDGDEEEGEEDIGPVRVKVDFDG